LWFNRFRKYKDLLREIIEHRCIPSELKFGIAHENQRPIPKSEPTIDKKLCEQEKVVDEVPFSVTDVVPHSRDGGVFIKYKSSQHDASLMPNLLRLRRKSYGSIASSLSAGGWARENHDTAYTKIEEHLKNASPRFGFSIEPVKAFQVLGSPWIDDMPTFPSKRLKVAFSSGDESMCRETIYGIFRRYGKIRRIGPLTAEPEHSLLSRFTIVQFRDIHGATAAKNCMHGYCVEWKGKPVRLRVSYGAARTIYSIKVRWIFDWIVNHTRAFATITTGIFLALVAFLGSELIQEDLGPGPTESLYDNKVCIYDGMVSEIKDTVMKGRRYILTIDCNLITKAESERDSITTLANQVGYRPSSATFKNHSGTIYRWYHQWYVGSGPDNEDKQEPEPTIDDILDDTSTRLKELAAKPKPVIVINNSSWKDRDNIIRDRLLTWYVSLRIMPPT